MGFVDHGRRGHPGFGKEEALARPAADVVIEPAQVLAIIEGTGAVEGGIVGDRRVGEDGVGPNRKPLRYIEPVVIGCHHAAGLGIRILDGYFGSGKSGSGGIDYGTGDTAKIGLRTQTRRRESA